MRSSVIRKQDGQTLIQVAIVMVLLLAIVALAIDVGQVYAERRRLQNASDAGALAGAWELCFGDPLLWKTTAEHYANDLNLDQAPWDNGAVATQPEDWQVRVVSTETVKTFLAGVVGVPQVNVAAAAMAGCGGARSLCGLWPLTFNEARWPWDGNPNPDANGVGCEDDFYVFNDSRLEAKDNDCPINKYGQCWGICEESELGAPPLCNCDNPEWPLDMPPPPPDSKRYVLAPGDRGWALLPRPEPPFPGETMCNNCGEQVKCWIAAGGYQGEFILPEMGGCVPDKTGVTASVEDPIDDFALIENNRANILIWDRLCTEGDPPVVDDYGCPLGDRAYHVVTTGCIHVEGFIKVDVMELADPNKFCFNNVKVVHAVRMCDCETVCGTTITGPPGPGEVRAVSLLE